MIAGIHAGVDGADVTTDLVNRESEEVRASDISKLMGGAVAGILPSFTDEDKTALAAFGQSPIGRKLHSLMPEIMSFNTQIANEPDPEFDAALDKVIDEVITDFITKHDAANRIG